MNVVLFALDACPTNCLGPYGNEQVGTPHLDRLAAEGVVFDRHISDRPTLDAARRSWPTPTATTDLAGMAAALDRLGGGPWLLRVESDRLNPPWRIPQDVFDAYSEDEDDEPGEIVAPWADPPVGWFDRDDLPSWEYLHSSVAAALTAFDAELGEAFELLRDSGLDRTTAWAFAAARGYPLGEHGIVGPFRPWLHEELVHLPLIVRWPDAAEAGRRVAGLTQPADLAAILAGTEPARSHAVTELELGDAAEMAIRTPEWALLMPVRQPADDDPRPPMLFAKPDDYWEVHDVRSQHQDTAEELERVLRSTVGPAVPDAGGENPSGTAGPTPK
jgi:arylsulfatase A-like enzyme